MKLTDWKQEALKLYESGATWRQVYAFAEKTFPDKPADKARDKVRDYLRTTDAYRELNKADSINYKSSIEYKQDGTIISDKLIEICENEDMTPEFLMAKHGLDVTKWDVVSYRNNYWHSQVKGGKRLVMYQSKITVKPKADGISFAEIDKHFAQLDRTHKAPKRHYTNRNPRYMAEVNIADLHLGKLCWHGDTGNNFDYKIAQRVYSQIVSEVCDELKGKPIEYITFVWSNDFFNSDTIIKTTTAGTPQDTDIRWQKLFNVGTDMLIDGISLLSEIAPVKTFWTASNHDEVTGYHAIKYLDAWFRKDPDVQIDTDARARKYLLYGNTLIGFTHGDKERAKRLQTLMPNEAAEWWSQSKYHEFHTAHLHKEDAIINEDNGVIVRRISSPTATDTWHYQSGYVGAVRKAQTFIYDKERGLIYTINTPVQ